jgi:hypothetical protein
MHGLPNAVEGVNVLQRRNAMSNGHKGDIKALEKKVTSISNALSKLSSAEDFRKLIMEWRRPGWTTPVEFIFVRPSWI